MKKKIKKLLTASGLGKHLWQNLSSSYHNIRRKIKHAVQKHRDFKKYIYPVIGKHPGKKDVFLVMTPTYKNLGDHAIAKAELKFLTQCNIKYKEIDFDLMRILHKHHSFNVFGSGIILITGGGFIGTLYPHMQEMVENIIEQNPKSKVILLPGTLYYEQSPEGNELFEHSKILFSKNNVRKIYLREKISYELISKEISSAKLMPDMAMSLNESRKDIKRKGCLIVLRNDKERILDEEKMSVVHDRISNLFDQNIRVTDMRHRCDLPVADRDTVLEDKFTQFCRAELVITDRLHGMVFAAITGTPCIVLNSKSHKVVGCYEWIRHLDYIRFCDNPEDICRIYEEMPKGEHIYDMTPLIPWFEEMKRDLLSIINA